MSDHSITITFEPTIMDLYNGAVLKDKILDACWVSQILRLLIVGVLIGYFQYGVFDSAKTNYLFLFAAIFILCNLHRPLIILPLIYFRSKTIAKEPVTLIINDEEVIFKTKNANSNVKWDFFTKYAENEKLILLMTGKKGKSIFYTILKSAFSDEKEIEIFRTFLENKIEQQKI